MSADIQRHTSAEALQLFVADAFCDRVHRVCETSDTFNVSLSGGSTPKKLYELLSKRDLPWDKIHWFWGDERNVLENSEESNFRMVREALLDPVGIAPANIHPVPVQTDAPEEAASRYDQLIREHFQGTRPDWDLVLLGMGDDAHTASLFPGTDALGEKERVFVANWVEKFDAWRYTLTAPAINSGKEIWFLVTGEKKQSALEHVFGSTQDPQQWPSQLIQPTIWHLTEDAIPQSMTT